jgi:hypothetical protein
MKKTTQSEAAAGPKNVMTEHPGMIGGRAFLGLPRFAGSARFTFR